MGMEGQMAASLRRDWGNPATQGWNGQIESQKGDLQMRD